MSSNFSEEELVISLEEKLSTNKEFTISDKNIEDIRNKSKTLIISKINCDFKLSKEKAKDIVQSIWKIGYEPDCTLVIKRQCKEYLHFLSQHSARGSKCTLTQHLEL